MVKSDVTPDRGDLIWLSFSPQSGHEQVGRRPGLVLSPAAYNARTGLALVCPITSRVKGYAFEVALPTSLPISGVVLADQVRSLDWRARQAEIVTSVPASVVDAVLRRLNTLLRPHG
jgi:mRNA interferase MazF